MKSLLLSTFFSVVAFYLVMNNDKKRAILIMIFAIPFFYYPLENTQIHYGIRICMCGMIIFSVWLAMKLKKIRMDLKKYSPKVISLYYFLFIGIVLGCIYLGDGIEYMGGNREVRMLPSGQIINNSIFIILVILMLKVLVNFQHDSLFRAKIAKAFILTIFVQVFSQTLKILGMEHLLWNLFSPSGIYDIENVRNLGLWGGFGLGVYVVLIISLSLLYINNHKELSVTSILLVVIYSLVTGQRQTIGGIALFVILLIFIYTLRKKISVSYLVAAICILPIFLGFWSSYFSQIVTLRRFAPTIAYIQQGEVLMASGRQVAGLPFVLDDLKTNYPLTGKGLLNLGITKYHYSNIAGHVVWLNIYQKFGIIGVIYLLAILLYPLIKLFKISMKTNDRYVLKEGAILFSLMAVVFAQQFFDNFFSFSNTMLLYAFVYFWIFSFLNRQKFLNTKQDQIYAKN